MLIGPAPKWIFICGNDTVLDIRQIIDSFITLFLIFYDKAKNSSSVHKQSTACKFVSGLCFHNLIVTFVDLTVRLRTITCFCVRVFHCLRKNWGHGKNFVVSKLYDVTWTWTWLANTHKNVLAKGDRKGDRKSCNTWSPKLSDIALIPQVVCSIRLQLC